MQREREAGVDPRETRRVNCIRMSTKTRKQESFREYLSQFSGKEQEQAFGPAILRAYLRGELSPAEMMQQKASMKMLESFRAMEPHLDMDVSKYERMGRESGEAANKRMADAASGRLRERLALLPLDAANPAGTGAGAGGGAAAGT